MNNILNYNLCDGVDLHLIKSQKFKTNLLSLYINIPYSKNTATLAALLPMVLRRGTKKHPTLSKIAKHLEELYGASLYTGLRKKGDNAFIYFSLEFISDKYITESIEKNAAEFLKEIIFCPKIENGVFDKSFIDSEKVNLIDEIKGLINEKKEYADQKIKEISFPDSPYGIPHFGYKEDVDGIDEKTLFEFYNGILNSSKIDIFYSGTFCDESAKKLIEETFNICPRKPKTSKTITACKENICEIKKVVEKMDIVQSKLCIMFYTSVAPYSKDYYSMAVFNCIFGGSPFSKLFNNVREKLSLAYYVSSRVDRQKGTLMISSGIEGGKFNSAYDEIMLWLDKMQNGEFTDDEIMSAKKYLETNLNSAKDSLRVTEDYLLSGISEGEEPEDIDILIEKIKEVTKDEIIKAANKISLDSIFLLTNQTKAEKGE